VNDNSIHTTDGDSNRISGIVNYLDRGTLAVANQLIREDLGLSLGQMGLLLSAFSWSYVLCQLPVGALVSTFGFLVLARVVLGIGEAPQFPSAARVVRNWLPLKSRGTLTGIFNSASPFGSALTPLCLSVLIVAFNWRWAFIVTGALGLPVAAAWFALYRDPNGQALRREERNYLEADAVPAAGHTPKLTFTEWRAEYCGPT